jgi:outer membrane lipoprotein-sorting protein
VKHARCLSTLVAVASLLAGFAQAATPDAQAMLAASDAIRNPGQPFSMKVSLTEYKDGPTLNDSNVLVVYSKAEAAGGAYRTLIRYAAPTRDVGKLMLKNGNDLWFFDPNSQATIRISPQQRLLGQAANGDVVTVNLAHDYAATDGGEETVKDGDQRQHRTRRLDLKATAKDVTYDRIEMWVDADTFSPVKGKFYSESGALLKTAYYRRYQPQLGAERPTETVIIDGLNPKWVTVMRYSDYQWRVVPDAWFQRDYLSQFRGE